MSARRQPDSISAGLAAQIALGRIAIGIGATTVPGVGLPALGFGDPDGSSRALARLAGGRDLALGGLTLLALKDRDQLRAVTAAGALVDLGDAIAFSIALARRDDLDRAAATGIALAIPAAAVGAWLTRRLA